MRAPLCKLCGKEHWGDCDRGSPVKQVTTKEKPVAPKPKPEKEVKVAKKAKKKKSKRKPSARVETVTPTNRPRGRPPSTEKHLTNEKQKPWESEGISRRSWYRKKAPG